ncbi:MAG TPA: YciI family protein [Mycobacteriales bacterium]|nr:YciI family protein [Mycobacteriales bacterium]
MRFALLMYADPDRTLAMTASELETVMAKHTTLGEELIASGELVGGDGLALPADTVTLREEGSSVGPLVPGVEHLTAYYLVECADQDRAVAIGDQLLDFHVTAVEVRGIHDTVSS